ncbi:titin [Harmonia axyridis]|uniref:titin n=1 Tax=Harmonia axyridis TaxID=115357 RepID=UPI001E276278|nr:titin [Harmonia axyridis]
MKSTSADIPVWKKDLVARLRAQNNRSAGNQAVTVHGGQLSPPYRGSPSAGRAPSSRQLRQTSAGIRPCSHERASNETSAVVDKCSSLLKRPKPSKMVQERVWSGDYNSWESEDEQNRTTSESDSSEELHYGPGIVNRLKNKYLSLTLNGDDRKKNGRNLRKAASLEDILDGDDVKTESEEPRRQFYTDSGRPTSRYSRPKRDMKRARSMEAISRFESLISPPPPPSMQPDSGRPKSMHEYLLIADLEEGSDKCRKPGDNAENVEKNVGMFAISYAPRLNRPKRIAPVMNEREKPPADVVKQAKMIFEKRPEQRTKPPASTGEVAAKVASYKSIIVQSKQAKKPPVKTKPPASFLAKNGDAPKLPTENGDAVKPPATFIAKKGDAVKPIVASKPSATKNGEIEKPSAVFSTKRGDACKPPPVKSKILVENGDATKLEDIKPLPTENGDAPDGAKQESPKGATPENVDPPKIAPRIRATSRKVQTPPTSPTEEIKTIEGDASMLAAPKPDVSLVKTVDQLDRLCHTPDLIMTVGPAAVSTPSDNDAVSNECLSAKNKDEVTVPITEPLELIINNRSSPPLVESPRISQISPIPAVSKRKVVSPPIRVQQKDPVVLEKNLINAAKSLDATRTDPFAGKKVRRPPREPETNSIVFKFTDRKDVPDYVQNDRSRTAVRLERPKVGEGGIILLPGASIDESFTDEDEEIRKYLEAPPSPCDVTFINDNVLIDGKSSINQKTKKNRMRISFVESGPDVFEYPSESSLMVDGSPTAIPSAPPMTGHTVPNLSGSYLANYIPKATEEFQPGVTRSTPPSTTPPTKQEPMEEELLLEEVDQPITFSAGTNSDMLF